MSLLQAAGLHLGELLPPAPDNPRGFLENREVVATNRELLYRADRDWTCPPARIDHRTTDLEPLKRTGEGLRAPQRPWGFKDPRTLFTLPLWAAALGEVRLVGIHRNSHDIARSLAVRNGFSFDQARAIALAYAQRLAEAHRQLHFPIVSFDSDPDEFVDRASAISTALGLEHDRKQLESQFEGRLIHHRSSEELHPIDEYLAEAAKAEIELLQVRTAATVVRIWDTLASDLAGSLPPHLGPRFALRREQMLQECLRRLPDSSAITSVEPVERVIHLRNTSVKTLTWPQLKEPGSASTDDDQRWSHLIAPSLLDELHPSELPALLDAVSDRLERRGLAAIGGWILSSDDLPTAHIFNEGGVRATRAEPPYLHHFDEVTTALLTCDVYLAGWETTAAGRTHLYLTTDPTLRGNDLTPAQLRHALARSEQVIGVLEGDLAGLRAHSERQSQELSHLQTELQRSEAENDGAQGRLEALTDTVRTLENEQSRSRTQLARSEQEIARVKQALSSSRKRSRQAEKTAASARGSYERLARRRVVRVALSLARPMRPVFRLVRSMRGPSAPSHPPKPTETPPPPPPHSPPLRRSREEVIEKLRSRLTAETGSGPKVSIVILTRDGAHHLSRLFPALETTSYQPFEVIIVDNGSTDTTSDVLARPWQFPLSVITHDRNTSFSSGNNQAALEATGDLILFLNNDVEPIHDGWLGAMVRGLTTREERVAVGALLLHPENGDPAKTLTVQHAGIDLVLRKGAPRARNVSHPDPLSTSLSGTWTVAAATAAALMVRKEAFQAVSGFDEGYVYGAEDVDLCLKLGALGTIAVVGDACLFHHESSTQRAETKELIRINRLGNWHYFAERWGPTLTRALLRDNLTGTTLTSEVRSRTVAITLTHDDLDKGWGDYYTAHELGDAFEQQGWNVLYAERHRDNWYELDEDVDLVISLLDAYDVRQAPSGAYTIAWVRNWVDRWIERPWFDDFDLVVASSHQAAADIADKTRFDPSVIPLATNPERFRPGPPIPTFEADYAFTGNNWGAGRKLVPMLDVRADERFLVFGKGWDSEPRVARNWRGHLDYELLADLYRSVKVVLDDTAGPTLPHALLNGRVFDALAAGALVLTDNVAGSAEIFDGLLPTYSTRAELRSQLDTYLRDDALRESTVKALRDRVLETHTYTRVVDRLIETAVASIEHPRVAIKIGVPDHEQAERWGDTHFARSIATSLTRNGFPTEVHILPEWDRPDRQDCDVVIHLRGLTTYTPKPSHLNVLWIISHPDDLSPGECDKYDLVLVASEAFAGRLAEETDTPVVFMPQATNGVRFAPAEPVDALATEVLFVGNSRGQRRQAVDWALEAGLPLSVYGMGWEQTVPRRHLLGENFPNDRLATLYASAKVVLNDHWPDMRDRGFVSNRVFDVLGAGGVLVSDPVDGLSTLFGDQVPTYSSADELKQVVEDLLAEPERRSAISAEAADLIHSQHTFDHRAAQIAELIRPMLTGRPKALGGDVF